MVQLWECVHVDYIRKHAAPHTGNMQCSLYRDHKRIRLLIRLFYVLPTFRLIQRSLSRSRC